MMYDCPSWYFDLSRRVNVAGRRLEEKEGLFRDGITQFTCVLRIVTTNSHYLLACACERSHGYEEVGEQVAQSQLELESSIGDGETPYEPIRI